MDKKILMLFVICYYAGLFGWYIMANSKTKYEIKVLDVGQGDSIYIKTKDDVRVLVDGGDNYESDALVNREMFFPFCHLDYVFLTHPHADHLRGLNKLLERCSVSHLRFNDVPYRSSDFADFESLSKKFDVSTVLAGDEIKYKDLDIKVIWPTPKFVQSKLDNANDYSLVFLLKYGSFNGLFTGDLDSEMAPKVNLAIKNSLESNPASDFLTFYKVPHHGALNGLNKELLTDLKPKVCAISVGADNKYGHPNAEAVTFMSAIGCTVFRTDQVGTIEFDPI
jgi:competence protein ComEC